MNPHSAPPKCSQTERRTPQAPASSLYTHLSEQHGFHKVATRSPKIQVGKASHFEIYHAIDDTHLTIEEVGYQDTLQFESFWGNGSILGVAFTNIATKEDHDLRARIRYDYIHNWQRYANMKHDFDCPLPIADIRIEIHHNSVSSLVGTASRRYMNECSMTLMASCGLGDVLHGKKIGPDKDIQSLSLV